MTATGLGITENVGLTSDTAIILADLHSASTQIAIYSAHLTEKTDALTSAAKPIDAQKQSLLATQSVISSMDAAIKMIAAIDSASAAETGQLLLAQANTTANITLKLLAD